MTSKLPLSEQAGGNMRTSDTPEFHALFTDDIEDPWKPDPDLTPEEKTMRINNLAVIFRNIKKETE